MNPKGVFFMKKNHVYILVLTALMTAVICVLAPISVPVGPVPISLATFAVLLAAYLLGWKMGLCSVALYLLLGLIGVPVFAGYSAGLANLVGPTGGYLIGYLPLAFATGWAVERYHDAVRPVLGMIVGTLVLYVLGTAWLALQMHMSFSQALGAGVIPFLPGDAAKIVVTAVLGPILKTALKKAGALEK